MLSDGAGGLSGQEIFLSLLETPTPCPVVPNPSGLHALWSPPPVVPNAWICDFLCN